MKLTDPEAEPPQRGGIPQGNGTIPDLTPSVPTLRERVRTLLIGKAKDPLAPDVFRHVSLVAFLAWVGLGSDGLSSSCYGPEEACDVSWSVDVLPAVKSDRGGRSPR